MDTKGLSIFEDVKRRENNIPNQNIFASQNLGRHLNIAFSVVIKAMDFTRSHVLKNNLSWQLYEENNEDFPDAGTAHQDGAAFQG